MQEKISMNDRHGFIGRLIQKGKGVNVPLLLVLAGVTLVLFPSCQYRNPGYAQLEAQASLSPNSKAIMGTWRQRGNGLKAGTTYTRNLLIRSDGTGHWYLNWIPIAGGDNESEGKFNWTYMGAGLWTADTLFFGNQGEFRITENGRVLLGKSNEPLAQWYVVYDRQ